MTYNKTIWKSGDVVTSEKLNKLENGVAEAGGGLPIIFIAFDINSNTKSLNITPNDIIDEDNNIKAIPLLSMSETVDGDTTHYFLILDVIVCEYRNGEYDYCLYDDIGHEPMFYASDRNTTFVLNEGDENA